MSLGVEAEGDESRGGLSLEEAGEVAEGETGDVVDGLRVWELVDGFGFRLERSLDDMTRVCPPKIARRDAVISTSGPRLS